MARRSDTSFKVEDWNGYTVRCSHDGTFYIQDYEGQFDSNTLEGTKAKFREGKHEEVDIKGLVFSGYSEDGHGDEVQVYAFSALGNTLYRRGKDGRTERGSRYEAIYVFDAEKLKTRRRLYKEKNRIEKELEALMKSWPRIEAPTKAKA
jgi:hypothetical protein